MPEHKLRYRFTAPGKKTPWSDNTQGLLAFLTGALSVSDFTDMEIVDQEGTIMQLRIERKMDA